MTTSKLLRLLNEEEVERYVESIKKEYELSSTANLEIYFQLNRKLKQQVELKLVVVEEILNKRTPDYKAKQIKD